MDQQTTQPARRRVVRLPAGLPGPRVPWGRAVGTHLLIAVAVVLAGAGVWTAAPTGAWGAAVALEATALLLGGWALVLLGSTLTRSGRLLVEESPGRLGLPGSRPLGGLLLGLLVLSLLLPVTLLGARILGEPVGSSTFALVLAVLLLPLGLPVLVRVLAGRIHLPALVLDEAGVTWRGWSSETRLPWADLARVDLVADPGRRLVLRASAEEVSVPVGFLASDAALLAALVEACRTDRGRRAALGTDAALHGLGAGG
ncbi:PH domain-containing protein [Nocardioides marmotae]|uniref:Low molecular weight protein antigen 6 PH domain-containing protein n=1 Tax=Nocardioides marmotae TaxID=2663857 RepID=A0A6I3JF37_9ACTN|nr:PH domain-containing protein [Nocardioides marmotae]MCR6033065.1 hypothetical protein [Gordonia jinghuaiqii]MBC9732564.1 PH domain-containing protein [Nocardioides marmotae]MTB83683.1 hypothetical protein [Nocardioides marmotae]MTB96717.1 hypothetical protein [Nocardioides marmotae]QKE03072.1 PH domain-containing protein [Nocardioides marmotae]